MKARIIRPGFWTDEKVVQVSFAARLMFIACWQCSDDEGRFKWEPGRLKFEIFPNDPVDIGELGAELGRIGLIKIYPALGKTYACVPKFGEHQKIHPDRPSLLPAPPEDWAGMGGNGPTRAEIRPSPSPSPSPDPDPCPNPLSPPGKSDAASPSAIPPLDLSAIESEAGEPLPASPTAPETPYRPPVVKSGRVRRSSSGFIPPSPAEIEVFAASLNLEARGWTGAAIGGQILAFYDHFVSNGWKIGGRAPMVDWHAAFRQWVRRAPEFAAHSPRGGWANK